MGLSADGGHKYYGNKIHPLFFNKPYTIPPKRYSTVTVIVEDLET